MRQCVLEGKGDFDGPRELDRKKALKASTILDEHYIIFRLASSDIMVPVRVRT